MKQSLPNGSSPGWARAMTAALNAAISEATGQAFTLRTARNVSGGCIHRSMVVSDGSMHYFLKINRADLAPALASEAEGLIALRDAGARAPRPITHGVAAERAYLVMEYVELVPPSTGNAAALGTMLADLHESLGVRYGWPRHNFIGATTQTNTQTSSWPAFWRDCRVLPQLALLAKKRAQPGYGPLIDLGERLAEEIATLLDGHIPQPTLLHGDLWSGNAGFTRTGEPIVFDPAVYYGDRETDIAMAELFGGFPREFYDAYFELAPLDDNYPLRRLLYNLYHVLNHANLFGGSYIVQAEGMMQKLLSEAR